jgi:Arc/MetJ family transcription regulator
MATNLALDPELLDRVLRASGKRTKREAVTEAMTEYVARREQAGLIDLFGALDWDDSYNYKRDRT